VYADMWRELWHAIRGDASTPLPPDPPRRA